MHLIAVPSLYSTLAAINSLVGRPEPLGDVGIGTTIGRYKLIEKMGEGGCGSVWLAEQEDPVRRRVALKVIKLGMDTKDVTARFEGERQAPALMNHAHIAKVFDAGATQAGRPDFVMELVCGLPITRFCDERNLSMKALEKNRSRRYSTAAALATDVARYLGNQPVLAPRPCGA